MSSLPPHFLPLLPRLLPEGLLERIEAGETVAERREITALFVRFPGLSGPASASMPAEAVADRASRLLALCEEAARQHRGTLDKFVGESALLVFGAPRSISDPATRAALAAIQIRDRAREMSEAASCALQRGTVVAGILGSSRRAAWTAIGDAVNSAWRLLDDTAPGEVVAGHAVLEALSDPTLRVEALEPLAAKGKRLPLRRARLDRGERQARSVLLSREPELARIAAGLGSDRALLLVGPTGIGKSSLLAAALQRSGRPWLLRNAASAGPGAFVLSLLGECGDERGIDALRKAQLGPACHALARSILLLAGGSPCVFALDDLDAIDGLSLALLDRALPLLLRNGCSVIAAARSEILPAAETIAVAPLSRQASRELLLALRPELAGEEERIDALVTLSDGLPGRIEDLVADRTERFLARVDGLPPPGPAWLTALALLGEAPCEAIESTAGIDRFPRAALVSRAQELGLVEEKAGLVRIADPTLGAALVSRLVARERRRLHGRAAAALAQVGRADEALRHEVHGGPVERACVAAAALAGRHLAEGRAEAALELLHTALSRAAEEGHRDAAVARLEILSARALRRLGQSTRAMEALVKAAARKPQVEALLELAAMVREAGQLDRAGDLLALARRAAGSDRRALARVCHGEALLALEMEDLPQARAADAAIGAIEGDPVLEARRRVVRGRIALAECDPHQALALFAAAAGPLSVDPAERLELTCWMAEARAALGHREEALATLGQALQVAERLGSARLAARIRLQRVTILAPDDDAEEEARTALEAALRGGDSEAVARACDLLALLLHRRGRGEEASGFRTQSEEIRIRRAHNRGRGAVRN